MSAYVVPNDRRSQPSKFPTHVQPLNVRKQCGPASLQHSTSVKAPRKPAVTGLLPVSNDDGAESLLIRTIPNLRAFATSLCRDTTRADDLVQETLVKAWTNLARFEKGTNMKAWLFTILRNTFFSDRRKRHHEVEDVDGSQAARRCDLPRQQAHMEFADFMKIFALLHDDHKEALLLVSAEGLSYMEAAEITGVPVGTVKSRVNRARAALTKLLGPDAQDDFNPNAEFIGLVRMSAQCG